MSKKTIRRVGLAAAGAVTVGVAVFGLASLANAETTAPAPSPSSTAGPHGGPGGPGGRGHGGPAGAAVTGDELTKVTAAMKAKDSAVTVTSVHKDPDGSYDVQGTKSGTQVFYEVSADLKTFTLGTAHGPGGGGPGGPGHDAGTAVTGDELAKVTAAVKAKDSAVTVTDVHKAPDGSYHVSGTKAGARIDYRASADLKTITEDTHGPRK